MATVLNAPVAAVQVWPLVDTIRVAFELVVSIPAAIQEEGDAAIERASVLAENGLADGIHGPRGSAA